MTTATDPGFDPADIEAALRDLAVLHEDPDPTRRLDVYTDDAVHVEPGTPPVRGRQALLAREDVPVLYDVVIHPELIEGNGDLASAFGHFSCSFDDPSADRVDLSGHFLMTLRKEADSVWKVAREILIDDVDPS